MKSKYTNRVYNFIYRHKYAFLTYINTRYQYVKCFLKGVKIGYGCKFNGSTHFL